MLTETILQDNVMQAHVIENETLGNEIQTFADYLGKMGFELFSYSVCSVNRETQPRCLYSKLPNNLFERMIHGAGSRHCLFLAKAAQTGELYEAKKATREEFSDRLSDIQKLSIMNIGHREIGIVPTIHGDKAHVAMVGLKEKSFEAERQFLSATISKFGSEHADDFAEAPGLKSNLPTSYWELSELEARFVRETISGKNRYDIASTLGFNEITVSHIQNCVFKKLQVDNSHMLVMRVLELGLVGMGRPIRDELGSALH